MLSTRRLFFSLKTTQRRIFIKNFATDHNVIRSKAEKIDIPKNTTIHEYIWQNVNKWQDKTAVICAETQRSYTYGELHKKSLSITKFLKNLKLNNGDTVGIILPNLPEYPLILIGAVQAGLIVTTFNPNYTSGEIKRQVLDSKPKVIFTSSQLVPMVQKAIVESNTNIPVVAIYNKDDSSINGVINFKEVVSGPAGDPVDLNVEDIAFLPYSSGTTGLPKGVQLTHNNIVANLHQFKVPGTNTLIETQTNYQDVIPAFLPFFHIYGLTIVMLHSISMGSKLVTIPKFSSDIFIKVLKQHKPTMMYGVPNSVYMMTNNPEIKPKDLFSFRTIVSGAAPLGATDVERFHTKTGNKINLFQAYGLTETSPLALIQTNEIENGLKIGGSGLLISHTDAKIIPTDGSSTTGLGPNKAGELLIKGPQVMQGYHNNPKATDEVIIDGWFKTGDIAYYDEDGHFFITDRLKELIKVKGFQVAPAELEEILRNHPNVEDVAVVGVPHQLQGEAPKAFVVPKKKNSVTTLELENFVADKVSKHKHLLGGVVFIDSIPKNPSGKILRRELKKL